MKVKISSTDLYNNIVNDLQGAEFNLNCSYTLNNKKQMSFQLINNDIIGGVLEKIIKHYLTSKNFYWRENSNSQRFPDIYLSENNTKDFIELKSYNFHNNAAFDLGNFSAYCNSLLQNPKAIDTDYIICGYSISDSTIKISKILMKKIWEITCASKEFPIKVQFKRGKAYSIRPGTIGCNNPQFPMFDDKEKFINALKEATTIYKNTSPELETWHNSFIKLY